MASNLKPLGEALLPLARMAADAIMAVYGTRFATRAKPDRSPVTDADEAAEAIILRGLQELTPAIPVVAEEQMSGGHVPRIEGEEFWLVDPLDGTREFIDRNGEFTVNIALIRRGEPVIGVIVAPATGDAWLGTVGIGAWRFAGARDTAGRTIRARRVPSVAPMVLISRNHRDAQIDGWLKQQALPQTCTVGSSLKFCRIAEGAADLYPRFASISEWDTAAGQAVLEAAGGAVLTWENVPLRYGKAEFRNPGFLARGAA
jgi:3'(2'), 5'-bisphosphate nucleotidase